MRRGHILHLSRGVRCGTTWSDPVLASVAAMTALIRPRGPLPARTYWVRRILILGTALALVVALGNLLTGGSDGSAGPDRAVQAAAGTTGSPPPGVSGDQSTIRPGKTPKKDKLPRLAEPDGPCLAEDIQVHPIVREAVAGSPVTIRLRLTTRESPACYWHVSVQTVALKVTSGDDAIWSSGECPRSVPSRDLVLRQAKPVWVGVTWSAQRSDEDGCTVLGQWALPGFYHVAAAALAGEPADLQFQLTGIRNQATPAPEEGTGQGTKPGRSKSTPTATPSDSPSGAVEPG